MEKAQRLKSRITGAMFYPIAVLFVALAVLVVMMVFIVPRFEEVFAGLLNGRPMAAFHDARVEFQQGAQESFRLVCWRQQRARGSG